MRRKAPLLLPVLGLLAGVSLAVERGEVSIVPGALCVLVGLAGARGGGLWLGVGLGWCLGSLAPTLAPAEPIDPSRPVEVIGRPLAAWSRASHGWHVPFEVRTLRQGGSASWRASTVELWVATEQPPTAARLAAKGYLRPPREALNGPPRRPHRWTLSVGSTRLLDALASDHGRGWRPLVVGWRAWADGRLSRRPGAASSMARALLLGESEDLPVPWLLALRRLGLGHLIAVSGLHVGLVAGIAWLGLVWLPPQWRWIPVVASVALYLLLVGARPSLLRASVMSTIAVASLVSERRPQALNAWAVAVGGMVVWQPRMVLEIAFQLTAASTLGLIWLAPALARRWRTHLPPRLALGLAAGVAAHLFTLPWSVGVFAIWSPLSIILNLVAIPWTAVVLSVAAGNLLMGDLPGVGALAWWILERVVAPFGWLAELPVASWASRPTLLPVPVSVLIVGVVGWSLVRARPRSVVAVTLTAAGLLLHGVSAASFRGDSAPELVMLDVGQGEAILVRHRDEAILIDGGGWLGPGIGQRVVLPALVRLGVHRLEAVVLTHPDRDHCGGLEEIVHLLPVEELWTSLGWTSPCYDHLVGRAGVRLRPLWRGVVRSVGGWRLEVLHPPPGDRSEGNERSLVLRAEAGGRSLLLTADVGAPTERRLLEWQSRQLTDRLTADVLKLGHHGSRYSSSAEFIDRVQPRLALVSAGTRNLYGHPSDAVLERLAERGVRLYRTDRGGQIRVHLSAEGDWHVEQPWRRALP